MAEQDYLTPVFDGYSSDGTVRSTRNLRPAHFLFKIKSYSLLCETGAETIESHIFEAEGYKWNLCLYPKGNHKSEGNDHISLYLKVADTASLPCVWEVNAKLTFFVFDQLHDEYLSIQDGAIRRFHETKNEWGVPQLLPLDFFNDISKGYLVDDCCVFGVEVFVLKHTGRIDGLPVKKHGWKIKKVPTLDKALCSLECFTPRGILRKLHGYSKVDSVSRSNQKVYAECHKREKSQLDIKSHQDYTGTIRSMRDFGPAHFLLKIDSYSSLCKKGAEMYESHSFEAGGHK